MNLHMPNMYVICGFDLSFSVNSHTFTPTTKIRMEQHAIAQTKTKNIVRRDAGV